MGEKLRLRGGGAMPYLPKDKYIILVISCLLKNELPDAEVCEGLKSNKKISEYPFRLQRRLVSYGFVQTIGCTKFVS